MSPLCIVVTGWSVPSEYKYFILILGRRESRRVRKRGLRFVAPKGIVSLLDILTQHHVMFGKEAQKISRKKVKGAHLDSAPSCSISEYISTWAPPCCIGAGHSRSTRLSQHPSLIRKRERFGVMRWACGRGKTWAQMLCSTTALLLPREKAHEHRGSFGACLWSYTAGSVPFSDQ